MFNDPLVLQCNKLYKQYVELWLKHILVTCNLLVEFP
jgi:hypothetical protein